MNLTLNRRWTLNLGKALLLHAGLLGLPHTAPIVSLSEAAGTPTTTNACSSSVNASTLGRHNKRCPI